MHSGLTTILISILLLSLGCGVQTGPSLIAPTGASDGSSTQTPPGGVVVSTLANSAPPSGVFDGGLAVSPTGDLYSGTSGAGILKFTAPHYVQSVFNDTETFDVRGVAFDSHGTLWATATSDAKVFSITTGGVVTEVSPATNYPTGIAVAPNDDVYYLATNTPELRRIRAGVDTSVTAIPAGCYGIAIDAGGTIFITSESTHSVYRLTAPGFTPVVFAGNGAAATLDGTGAAAGFNAPYGLTVDAAGNLYVTEGEAFGGGGHVVRKITPAAVVTTLAGDGVAATTDGIGRAAQFWGPVGIAITPAGTLFVQEIGIAGGNVIRRLD